MIPRIGVRPPLSICCQTSDELFEGGPPQAAEQDDGKPRPLGVPEFTRDPKTGQPIPFTVEREATFEGRTPQEAQRARGYAETFGGSLTIKQPPRYWTGDEWKPASWSPNNIAELQSALVQVGLIGSDENISLGVFDTATKNAYRKLLETANATGVTWTEALSRYAEAPVEGEGLQVQLTDPNDLRRVFKEAAFQVSATQFEPGQIDAMVAAYHEKEREYQEAKARGDETVFAPPDPGTFVETEAERVNPEGVLEQDVQDAEDAWMDAIGSLGNG